MFIDSEFGRGGSSIEESVIDLILGTEWVEWRVKRHPRLVKKIGTAENSKGEDFDVFGLPLIKYSYEAEGEKVTDIIFYRKLRGSYFQLTINRLAHNQLLQSYDAGVYELASQRRAMFSVIPRQVLHAAIKDFQANTQ